MYGLENFGSLGSERTASSTMFDSFKSLFGIMDSTKKGVSLANSELSELFKTILNSKNNITPLKEMRDYFKDINKMTTDMDARQMKVVLGTAGELTDEIKSMLTQFNNTGEVSDQLSDALLKAGQSISQFTDPKLTELSTQLLSSEEALINLIKSMSKIGSINSNHDMEKFRDVLSDVNQLSTLNADQLEVLTDQYGLLTKEVRSSIDAFRESGTINDNLLKTLKDTSRQVQSANTESLKSSLSGMSKVQTSFKSYVLNISKASAAAAASVFLVFKPLVEAALETERHMNELSKSTDALMDLESRRAFVTSTAKLSSLLGEDMKELGDQFANIASDLALPYTANEAGIKSTYGKVNPTLETYLKTAGKLKRVADVSEESLRDIYKAFKSVTGATGDSEKSLKVFASTLSMVRSLNGMTREETDKWSKSLSTAMTNIGFSLNLSEDQTQQMTTQWGNMMKSFVDYAGPQSIEMINNVLDGMSTIDGREGLIQALGMSPDQMEDILKSQDLTPIKTALLGKLKYLSGMINSGMSDIEINSKMVALLGDNLAGTEEQRVKLKQSILKLNRDRTFGALNADPLTKPADDIDKKWSQIMSTVSGTIDRLSNSWNKFYKVVGAPLLDALSPVLNIIGGILEGITNTLDLLPSPLQDVVGLITGLGIAFGAAAIAAGIFGLSISPWITIPTLIIAAFYAIPKALEYVFSSETFKSIWDSYSEFKTKSTKWLNDTYESIKASIFSSIFSISQSVSDIIDSLSEKWNNLTLNDVFNVLKNLSPLNLLLEYIFGTDYMTKVKDGLKDIYNYFVSLFSVDNLMIFGSNLVEAIKQSIFGLKDKIFNWIGLGQSSNPATPNTSSMTQDSGLLGSMWDRAKELSKSISTAFTSNDIVPSVAYPTVPSVNPATGFSSPKTIINPQLSTESPYSTQVPIPSTVNNTLDSPLFLEMVKQLRVIAGNTEETPRQKQAINTWTPRPFTDAESYTTSVADSARRSNTGG